MPEWPASLPQRLEAKGFSQSRQDTRQRTEMDAGPAKMRRRFTAAARYPKGTVTLTDAQLVTFWAWFQSDLAGGALSFDWVDPRDGATPVSVRFVSVPDERDGGSPGLTSLTLDLEILP